MLKNFINNLTDKVNEKVNTIKQENERYKNLLETTTTFQNLYPIPELNNKEVSQHKIITITNECPDINKDKAKLISTLIPVDQTFLSIIYTQETKTKEEYYLIPTDKYFWIISKKSYGIFPYQNFSCQIIKNNLMSKTILLNNILLEASGNDIKINTLINILTNQTVRNNLILEKTAYLCGITPIYQKINTIYSGISIDNYSNIVFHTKDKNYKYNANDILYYEILLDNTVIFSNNNSTISKITTFQSGCYQISIRITTKDNTNIIMPILEPNSFNTKYERNDTTFQTNLEFANTLTNKLKEILPQIY